MSRFIKTVGNEVYHMNFNSNICAHFCVTNLDASLKFCFDWDFQHKLANNFLDSKGNPMDDKYPVAIEAIKFLDKIYNLKIFL